MKMYYGKTLSLFVLLAVAHRSLSQSPDSTKQSGHFGGAVSVTNNGISLIPTFSLGKPAAIFDLSVGGRKLSFEPQLRFGLDGKPWTFLFWWRYKLASTNRFRLTIGAHPALNFKPSPTTAATGEVNEMLVTRRYVAGELAPNYALTRTVSVGMYYLYSHGLDPGTTKNTHFLTVNTTLSNIRLSNQLFLRVTPQVYYLKLDEQDGFYVTSAVTLTKRNFPLTLSVIVNKTIQTRITASKDFVWNATLMYAFTKNYVRQ